MPQLTNGATASPTAPLTDNDSPWYILRLRPGGLSRAVKNLERQGVITFCPERLRTMRRNGRLITGKRPLFPGYLFISLPDGGASWRSINGTYGVASVVCLEPGRPSPIPEELVTDLMAYCDQGTGSEISSVFKKGDEVRIILGPFSEMMARIEAFPEKDRIHVLFDMMGRSVRAYVSPGDLERVA